MKVEILREAGYDEAILGLSLSYNTTIESAEEVAVRLYDKDGGHNKFLESIVVWLDITAPTFWWIQMDTYRVGMTKQSQSTMHTVMRRPLTQSDFWLPIPPHTLNGLNELIAAGNFVQLINNLPKGHCQRRIVCTNYKALRHIVSQRHDHQLVEWQFFVEAVLDRLDCPEFVEVSDAGQ